MKIAVYTIALNEEKFVERWYESAKDADYLLIADTGSTDKTKRIAKKLGIKVVDISIKPWRFDDARNTALALLPDDIDYCISMDMDETLSEGWREHLETMTSSQVNYYFNLTFKDESETVPLNRFINERIHKRHGFRWKALMHEYLVLDRLENYTIDFCEGLEISHHPDPEKSREQYTDLIKAALAEDPESKRYHFYEAMQLRQINKKESIKVFKKMLKLKGEKDLDLVTGALCELAKLEINKFEYWVQKAIDFSPQRREPLVMLAAYALENEDWQKAYDNSMAAVNIVKKYYGLTTGEFAWGHLPYNILAVARNNKDLDKDSETYNQDKLSLPNSLIICENFDLFGELARQTEQDSMV
jgi:glycosyltransferase involved in cell wall biosynthesis